MSSSGSRALGLWLLSLVLCARLGCLYALANIDVLEPIIRRSPAAPANSEDYFGYSVTLHQLEIPERSNFPRTLKRTRIVVGAPQGSFPGGLDLNGGSSPGLRTGLVYQCPVMPGSCGEIFGEARVLDMSDPDASISTFQPLFDGGPSLMNEEKEGQLMGATVESTGNFFVACAPLWVSRENSTALDGRRPQGRCFVAPRDLSNFTTLRPCLGGTSLNQVDDSFCLTGTSATVLLDALGDRVVLGSPGFNTSKGQLFYYNPNQQQMAFNISFEQGNQNTQLTPDGEPVEGPTDTYQGFAVTTGRIFSTDQRDIVTTIPRWNGATYTGRIQVYSLPNLTEIQSIFATGTQTGEYFGWAIATADLNGDGLDEVIVGAPMNSTASQVEKGGVYVFNNTGGNLSNDDVVFLTGPRIPNGRFGSSVVNIGDVNDDGYEDIAIGAPWEAQNPNANGTVYIYYGSPTELITRTPQQIIRAADVLESVEGLTELKTFGYSLASGVDVDANEYYDLLVGAFSSQVAVLFRTLSLATVTVNVSADRASIDVTNANCPLGDEMFACFTVTVCASYSGRGLDGRPLNATLEITEQNTTHLVFDNPDRTNTYRGDFRFSNTSVQTCEDVTAYINSSRLMIDEIFVLNVSFPLITRNVPQTVTGNDTISDFRDFPILKIQGETIVQVGLDTRCDDSGDPVICDSNLQLQLDSVRTLDGEVLSDSELVIIGGGTERLVRLIYSNNGEDAYGSQLTFTLPSFLQHVRVEEVTPPIDIDCVGNVTMDGSTEYTCQLQSPITQNSMTTIDLRWQDVDIIGNEEDVDIQFMISITPSAQNREDDLTDNRVTLPVRIDLMANLRVTSNGFSPTSILYSDTNPLDATTNLRISDLGSPVEMFASAENEGPATVLNARVNIYFPLNSSETGNFYYIYPDQFINETTGMVRSVECDVETFLNPDGLLPSLREGRRKRSTMSVEMYEHMQDSTITRTKRQNAESAPQTGGPGLNCAADRDSCRLVQCSIRDFGGNSTISFSITGFIDQRFYTNQDQTFVFESLVEVVILDDFITDTNPNDDSRPSDPSLTVGLQETPDDDDVPLFVLILAALGGFILAILLLALIIAGLCYIGFFRRKRYEEKDEEYPDTPQPPPPTGAPPDEEKPPLDEESKPEIEPEETSL